MTTMRMPPKKAKAPIVRMRPHKKRILNAILLLINEADRRDIVITQYDIIKSLFLADKSHLNRYGRPITFDNYVAMQHGPVPSFAYDLLKHKVKFHENFGIESAPWERIPCPEKSSSALQYSKIKIAIDENILSESDIETLSDALATVSSLSFGQIRKLTHEDPAYTHAWEDEGEPKKAYDMSYALFFEVPDYEKAEELSFNSEYI